MPRQAHLQKGGWFCWGSTHWRELPKWTISLTGTAVRPQAPAQPGPFSVRLDLDDPDLARELGINPGTVGSAAIYTSEVTVTHIIRKVMIRMDAIMNFIKPA